MKHVLSLQSHVVYGYAGNKAATFPMQTLGIDVWAFNTVQFSNHTQYQQWTGMVLPKEQIGEITRGIDERGFLGECDAVLSGYIGAKEQGEEIINTLNLVKKRNPNAIYFCDPVMGHPEKGCIVAPGVAEFLIEQAANVADFIAPNLLELKEISGLKVTNFSQAVDAAVKLSDGGKRKVLVKHLGSAGKSGEFEMLLIDKSKIYHIQRPLHDFDRQPVGVGDLTSAIFLADILNGKSNLEAFEHTANAVNDVMQTTKNLNKYELQIIAARDFIINPRSKFTATEI